MSTKGDPVTGRSDVETDQWKDAWAKGRTAFHEGKPNELLAKYVDALTGGKSAITIFVPLCGKTVDMKWLYDRGHSVVGIEVADQAIEEFFTESKLEFTKEKVDKVDGTLYKSSDGRIRLYACDFYKFSSEVENGMQGIWDRASLVAINKKDREKYMNILRSVTSKDCRYLLEVFDYDPTVINGPPHTIPDTVLSQIIGDTLSFKFLDERKLNEDEGVRVPPHWRKRMDELSLKLYLVTRRVDTAQWKDAWAKGRTIFHEGKPNEFLEKHVDALTGGKSAITIFVPLCGKTVDLKWLYDRGHSVVGVEVATQAIEEFFSENNLEFTKEEVDKVHGTLYKSYDGRIRLYACDLYDFSSKVESGMLGVWDRGSLVAINKEDREKYMKTLRSVTSDDCRYLVEVLNYNSVKLDGPPHSIPKTMLAQIIGDDLSIELLDERKLNEADEKNVTPQWRELMNQIGLNVYLLKNKATGDTSLHEWLAEWENGNTLWHVDKPSQFLVDHYEAFTSGSHKMTIFVPLCGKTEDMFWLYSRGHTVVGLDIAALGIEQFLNGHNINFSKQKVDKINGTLYTSEDGRIRLYACDLFKLTNEMESGFNGVYDRMSFAAINIPDREKYVELVLSMCAPDCRILLETVTYQSADYSPPPHSLEDSMVREYFDGRCNIRKLDSINALLSENRDRIGAKKQDHLKENLKAIVMLYNLFLMTIK